ncbi:MAG TPA: hypothetical protein VL173_00415 [Vicinamibacterales bacterium]|nr:hypothetical protein [Vicinamibacterales bacterium]
MRRRQLIEIEDLAWCPRTIRDGGTEWLAFLGSVSGAFTSALGPIRRALNATGTNVVVDLCSGAGGPMHALAPALCREGIRIVLSDLYPNVWAFVAARQAAGVEFCTEPVDATRVPRSLTGVRTMFNAFHHFDVAQATAVLADAVAAGQAIAIFEGATTRALGLIVMPAQIPAILLMTPFVRPFRWSRLLFTYVLPLIPLLVLFDGTVSFLRLYTRPELEDVVAATRGHEQFDWEIGSLRVRGLPAHVSYLLGIPKRR